MLNAAPFFAPLSMLIVVVALYWRAFHEVANPGAKKIINGETIVLSLGGLFVFWLVALGLAGG